MWIAAAQALDKKVLSYGVVIAVVDDGGHLILLRRLDDTQVASVNVGIGKARTAAIYSRPTLALADSTPLQGGVPITLGSQVIGAIGVSGDTSQVDEAIALAGARVFSD